LHLLARSAAGSMRDALSLLDQAIAHGSGKVEEAQVREMLGAVDLDHLFSITDALLAGDAAAMLQVADEMAARSLSFDTALQEMASLFTRLQVAQIAPQAIADDLPERERLLDMASRLDPEFVQLAYQIAVHGRHELPLAPDEQAGFIMTLLRLYAFRPALDDDSALREPPATATRRTAPAPFTGQAAPAPAATAAAQPAARAAGVAPGEADPGSLPNRLE
jgi:DNA polymerase-3 subunit gamma/tau